MNNDESGNSTGGYLLLIYWIVTIMLITIMITPGFSILWDDCYSILIGIFEICNTPPKRVYKIKLLITIYIDKPLRALILSLISIKIIKNREQLG